MNMKKIRRIHKLALLNELPTLEFAQINLFRCEPVYRVSSGALHRY